MMKSKILPLLFLALFCVVFWNVLHFIYTVGFSGGAYTFSVFDDVCLPAVIGMTVGVITSLRRRPSGK